MAILELVVLSLIIASSPLAPGTERVIFLFICVGYFSLLPPNNKKASSVQNIIALGAALFSAELIGLSGNVLYYLHSLLCVSLIFLTRMSQGKLFTQLVKQFSVMCFYMLGLAAIFEFELKSSSNLFHLVYTIPCLYILYAVMKGRAELDVNRQYHGTVLFLASASIPYLDYIGANIPNVENANLILFFGYVALLSSWLILFIKGFKDSWANFRDVGFVLIMLSLYIHFLNTDIFIYYITCIVYFGFSRVLEKSRLENLGYRIFAVISIGLLYQGAGSQDLNINIVLSLIGVAIAMAQKPKAFELSKTLVPKSFKSKEWLRTLSFSILLGYCFWRLSQL